MSERFTLFTDTDCDITPEIAKEYGMKLISMPYTVDGVEYEPYVSWEKYDYKGFYNSLREGTLPTTSALSPLKYIEYIEPEFKAGRDVVYVHFSAAMSATFNSLRLALEELKEKYPERKLTLIDTKMMTLGSYIIVKEIGKLYKAGASEEELVKWADENIQRYALYFYADDLKFFHKSGRVSGFASFFGGLVGIKPIIYISEEGVMTTKTKARGRKGSLEKLLSYVIELEDHMKDYTIGVASTDAEELADEFITMLKEHFGNDLNIEKVIVNPTAGAHCGPNAIGICFHAKHR